MKQLLVWFEAIALFSLTSCMVGPKYAKPSAPMAPTFKETTDAQAGDGLKIA
jgi:predicted small lipoprotein YifL